MAHNNPLLINLSNNFVNETTIALKKRKREENLRTGNGKMSLSIEMNVDVPNEVTETENNAEVKEEHVIVAVPNQHDVDDDVSLAPIK
ncbi:hypothetical protein Tco_0149444 [Tanacetum coccineum]